MVAGETGEEIKGAGEVEEKKEFGYPQVTNGLDTVLRAARQGLYSILDTRYKLYCGQVCCLSHSFILRSGAK